MKNVLKKIFWTVLILCAILFTGVTLIITIYEDELIAHVVQEANKSLNTPVSVEEIDMSVWHHFPRVSFRFKNIDIKDSFANNDSTLLFAEVLDLSFNPLQAAFGDVLVDNVYMENASVHLRMNSAGEINYNIFKASTDTIQTSEKVKLELAQIDLSKVQFKYSNDYRHINLDFFTPNLAASLVNQGSEYYVLADGDMDINFIETGGKKYTWDFPVNLTTELTYNDSLKDVQIAPSIVRIMNSEFDVSGSYSFLENSSIDLSVASKATNVETLLALLQSDEAKKLSDYSSNGDVYLKLAMAGSWKDKSGPGIDISFGLKNADITHNPSGIAINNTFLTGTFLTSDILNPPGFVLQLEDVKGSLGGQAFSGNLLYKNPDNPFVVCAFDGTIDFTHFLKFMPVEGIKNGRGLARANIKFEGLLGHLKQKKALSRITTSGDFTLNSVYLEFSEIKTGLRNVNGNLLFNNNDLALSDVSGFFGRSDFLLNGYFKNVIAYLLFEEEPVGIESSLKSRLIDMDELLSLRGMTSGASEPYSFTISNRLRLNFDCEIDQLIFRRFKPTQIRGDLKVKNKVAFTDKLELRSMGGELAIYGMVDASKDGLIRVNTHFDLDDIAIDSIFYVFENFNQDFLVDRHLKGAIDASIEAEMVFNDKLRLYSETLSSHITTSIRNGELNDFEPMQRLSKYLDERELERLRFSELKNEIIIKDRTIFLPQMEVGTNVTDIKISGTHTFDQEINYSVAAPLRGKPKYDTDEAFGAIREDTQGRSMVFLKIVGTTAQYEVLYDQEQVKEKIAKDLQKEAAELKEIFKNKGKRAATPELTEDDYFEWDNDGDQ